MSVTVATGIITFEYTFADLLVDIEKITSNIASKLESTEVDTLDKFVLTADELVHFMTYLEDAHNKVSSLLEKMAFGIDDAMVLDEEKLTYNINQKSEVSTTVLSVFDELISEVIKNFILKEWFVQTGLKDQAEYYNILYLNNVKSLVKKSITLRKSVLA